jgi:hypothetical protein
MTVYNVAGNGQRFVEKTVSSFRVLYFYLTTLLLPYLQEPATKLYPIQMNSICNLTPYFLKYT